jgi:cytochrome bd-type quinol oxidase subunit 1
MRRNDPRLDRLSKSFIWFSMILFSPGAALGTGIPVFLIGTYPEFWSRWANLFFWPLVVQFLFFLAEVGFLLFGYYLTWDRWSNRKRLHITMGVAAATMGLLVQVVWDALGGYMMTPGGVALPGVDQPVGWSAAAFFNPSFPYLLTHRIFGNFSYVMLLTGGVFALRFMTLDKKPEEKRYFGWACNFCFITGFLFFFAMPIIGWGYAKIIQAEAPVAFHAIMGGHVSPHFTVKMGLIALMLVIAMGYLTMRYRGRALAWATTAGMLVLLAVVHLHPPLDWLGPSAVLWRVVVTIVIGAPIAWVWLMRGRGRPDLKRWQWLMFVAGLAAFFAFCLGGFVRERSKSPDTVYGQIVKPELTQMEADRYLVYETCIGCHHRTPKDLDRYDGGDWPKRVAIERSKRKLTITDAETERIIRYLQEHHP